MQKFVKEPERETPILYKADVIVAGGGLAGVAAAIAAARLGVKTILLERFQFLGGTATGVMPGGFGMRVDLKGNKIIGGIVDEIIARLDERGASHRVPWMLPAPMERQLGLEDYFKKHKRPKADRVLFNFEQLKLVCDDLVKDSGVTVLFDTRIVDVFKNKQTIQGLIAEGKSGRFALSAEVIIDATGDGDVSALSGAEFGKGRDHDGLLQPVSIMFLLGGLNIRKMQSYEKENDDKWFPKAIMEAKRNGDLTDYPHDRFASWRPFYDTGIAWFNATRITHIDASQNEGVSRGIMIGRHQVDMLVRFLRKYIPGCGNAYILSMSSHLGVRETRRIVGDYVLNDKDVLSGRRFPDVVARQAIIVDVHNPAGAEFLPFKLLDSAFYEIPYRCLIARSLDNLLVAGRCISSTHIAHGATRAMVVCIATGEAAGTAAALSFKNKVNPRNLSINMLHDQLKIQNALPGPEPIR